MMKDGPPTAGQPFGYLAAELAFAPIDAADAPPHAADVLT
jgi:hypothetical protein